MNNRLIIKEMRRKKTFKQILGALLITFTFIGCNLSEEQKVNEESEVIVIEEPIAETIEVDVWVIDEHKINNVALTSKAKVNTERESAEAAAEKNKKTEAAAAESAKKMVATAEAAEELYEIATLESLEAQLAEEEYVARQIVEVTETIIPLEETQTLVSYNKKGEELAAFQVISTPGNDEIEQIIFTDKKHHDVYNVQAGMSGKEVKRLRKELKHMKKKGQVFLYDDTSNIMYLMTATDEAGDEYVEADIETMEVQAIIWKDKKHHKHDNK